MIHQARKFAEEPRTPIVALQWANWAHAIAGRHTHAAARHEHMTLTLAHRQLIFQSARWEKNAWTFAPQIRLAITAFLPLPLLQSANKNQTRREPDAARTLLKRGMRGPAGREDKISRGERESFIEGALNSRSRTAMFVYQNVFSRMQAAQYSPLARIVARLEHAEATIHAEPLVLSRVAQVPQRVEERSQRVPLVLQNPAAANGEGAAQGVQEANSFERIPSRGRSGNVPWETPTAPPINLDQLTDQVARRIDNRITAYRERRGKGA